MRQRFTDALRGTDWFGHPAGLYVLFGTEMWERFSYYGMRALLVLYMTTYLLADSDRAGHVFGYGGLEQFLTGIFGTLSVQQMSSQIYGLYTGFVYFTPFFGGMLADRLMGRYRTVYLGGTLMAIGHFLMASERMFLVALLFLIAGNGCFKPNISTQVGELYPAGDARRDGAFTIFYMGVNLGAFFSPLVCGTLGQTVGWHWGFGAAGVGMLLGMCIYWLGSGLVPKSQRRANNTLETAAVADPVPRMSRRDWISVVALVFLCSLNIMFWAVYEQQGNTMQLWADQRTDWGFFGLTVPSTWYQSFNPAMIFLLAPLLNMFWNWRARNGHASSSVGKMGLGCCLLGLGYVGMIVAARVVPEGQRGSILWLTGTTFVFTLGELYLSPIGLSLVTKVAPRAIVSTMMGVWFLSSFFGNYLTGYLGTFYDTMPKDQFFLMLTLIGGGTGVVFMIVRKPMERVIGKHV